jgi:hypothetical protein
LQIRSRKDRCNLLDVAAYLTQSDLSLTTDTYTLVMMELQTLLGLSHMVQTLTVAALILAICAYIPQLRYKTQLAKLPVLGGEGSQEKQRQKYLKSAKQLYIDGYRKVRQPRDRSIFLLTTTQFTNVVYSLRSSDGMFVFRRYHHAC